MAYKSGDLIRLVDSPPVCPTGVLVDLTEEDKGPAQPSYPTQLLTLGEFDDTFGIYNTQQRLVVLPSSSHLTTPTSSTRRRKKSHETRPKVNNKSQDEVLKKKNKLGVEKLDDDPFFTLFSPIKQEEGKLCGWNNEVISENEEEDSDSLLDINNLSGFSVSDSDDILQAAGDNEVGLDAQTNDQLDLSQEIKELLEIEKVRLSEQDERNKVRRKDSFSSKLQRLSILMSSPISSPPSPTPHYLPTPCVATPTVHTQLFSTPNPHHRAVIPYPPQSSTASNWVRSELTSQKTKAESKDNENVENEPEDANGKFREPLALATHQPSQIVKRLSFTSCSDSSPLKSSGIEEKRSEGPNTPPSFTPIVKTTNKVIAKVFPSRPVGPLKATAPFCSPASRSKATSHLSYAPRGVEGRSAPVPVTPKFIPPPASASPYAHGGRAGGTPTHLATPTRGTRKSLSTVKSSGYGRPSPVSKPQTPAPLPSTPSGKGETKQGIRSFTPSYLPSSNRSVGRMSVGRGGPLPQQPIRLAAKPSVLGEVGQLPQRLTQQQTGVTKNILKPLQFRKPM